MRFAGCLWRAIICPSLIKCSNKVQCDTRPVTLDISSLMVQKLQESDVNAFANDEECNELITVAVRD